MTSIYPRAHGPTPSPTPISWPPSQYWDGDDGSWSSFALRVGNPEQDVRVLISTASENTWVIQPGGCPPNIPGINPSLTCPQSRGQLFDPSRSGTWVDKGNYDLGVDVNLGADADAAYGFDTVALGFSNATGGPTLSGQVVAALESNNFYTGLFGLGNQPTNFTASIDPSNLTDTVPYMSFLATMKNQSLIPSQSWAYTAGAEYRDKGNLGSVTFGGYDSSRLIPNNVTMNLAPDIQRDLVVGLQSLTTTAANGSAISLLPSSILTFIDSTLPFIYLPLESCQAFESAFGLIYNDTARLYTVDDTLHQSLIAKNPNFTFQIGNHETGGPTVDIVLPYASFDLLASYPRVLNATRYFPLRRAANETQYTLGRTFLQEAYLITNYEHNNFSISQARFDGLPENLVALPSADLPTTPKSHHGISHNSIIGLAIGLTAFLVLVTLLVYFMRKRLRKSHQENNRSKPTEFSEFPPEIKAIQISGVYEADNNHLFFQTELPDNGKVELLDGNSPSGSGNKISEMPQSPSPAQLFELGTRHTSLATSSLRRQSDRNRNAILVSNGLYQRESRDSSGALKEIPFVETRISASPRHKSVELGLSLPTPPPPLTPEYLNRALPSTPDSDSTQISQTKTALSSLASACKRFGGRLSSRTSMTSAHSGATAPPDTALEMIWKDYDMSWECNRRTESLFSSSSKDIKIMMPPPTEVSRDRQLMMREYPSLSSISMEIEIVVPPGTPNSQIPSQSKPRAGGERRARKAFF